MIVHISTNQMGRSLGTTPVSHPDIDNTHARRDLDASLQVDFADLISRAKQATEADPVVTARARQLLQSNQLTTEQNIRAAAEGILTSGI